MKLLSLVGLLLLGFTAAAQITMSGNVINTKGQPLAGAAVTLIDTYDGTTSDSLGFFSFQTTETGAQKLEISLAAYLNYEETVVLEGKNLTFNIILKKNMTNLEGVVLTAGAFEASDKKKGTVLNSLDIVTTAGANADITAALKTLPGAQQVGESEGLFVRGGSAAESKIFIDGNLVNNFYYSSLPGIATRGRFNPFLFKGTVFSAGGYSALYGQALSAALILESTDLPEKSEGSFGVSVIGGSLGYQHLAKNKKSSYGMTINYTNLSLAFKVLKQNIDFNILPQYTDGDINFRIKTKKGIIKYYGYGSLNKVGFRSADIDSANLNNAFEMKNANTYQNITWNEALGKGWKLNAGISYSYNKDSLQNILEDTNHQQQVFTLPAGYADKNYRITKINTYAQGRAVFEKRLSGLNKLRFGAEYFYSTQKLNFTDYNNQFFRQKLTDNLSAAFAETDIYLSENIAAKIGGRAEYADLLKEWNLAPRASLAYKINAKSQVSLAYGQFYQLPEIKNLPLLNNNIGYAKATHYIAQYQKADNDRIFRTEVFYKAYNNLYKTNLNGTAINNNGNGYAQGIEIFWRDKKTISNLDYWISYSYLDTKRDYVNYPQELQPSFAAKHTASLVMKKFVLPLKTGFNASYTFATGRPYYQLLYNNAQSKFEVLDKGLTKPYNSLSFSLNYLPNLGNTKAKLFSVVVLTVSNVLGQKQVYGYNYGPVTQNKEAITPNAKRFVFLGWFVSFGVDRTQEAINNNL